MSLYIAQELYKKKYGRDKLPQAQPAEMLSVEKIDEINDLIYRVYP